MRVLQRCLQSVALSTLLPAIALLANSEPLAAVETQPVAIKFQAKVGDRPFQCGASYALGKPATPMTVGDFRFYISDVSLIDATGKAVSLNLTQDGKWQYQNVALLDFENKTGACTNGTVETNNRLVGTVPKGNYNGIRFMLGLPFDLNHADATLAPSPLNLTSLWWSWQFGYKFARIDLLPAMMGSTSGMQNKQHNHGAANEEHGSKGFAIHLGSTGCQVTTASQQPSACSQLNTATITFKTFDPARNTIVADLAALVATTNLNQNQPKTSLGCMSEPEDGDCPKVMANLGISFNGKTAKQQSFFRAE